MFLLSQGLLKKKSKQQFATGLAAAVLLSGITTVGISATTAGAQPVNRTSESEAADKPVQLPGAVATGSEAGGELETGSDFVSAPELSGDVLVYPHDVDGRQAATLYVKDIPVLTFLGTDVDSLANGTGGEAIEGESSAATADEASISEDALENPVARATELGTQLDPEAIEAADISVRWQEESEGFVVTLADEALIALDSRTILADTTDDAAEDALQVTNRLRRLMGGAEPVSEIENMPEPEPVVEVAPVQQVAIVSSTTGTASWYGPGFHGRRTANGESFNQYALTAAHRTLPFGTRVLVTNLYTGRQVTVRINDRGPFSGNRIIDLSAGAAAEIGLTSAGVGTVQMDVLGY
ncbi:septal ring lytic transglycosylase RlpA family protein [cf. Phormidesmis sp. LEGE 11477]|uniref:septal ring lytic transglycosylase RlpA family protein n=1 Tax=cf. Phormidesmis sp. LEGE 11477 TaxID=1828680 RepID=UPI001882A50B|nr:septal ring lytic transglycosylase RlpA family protein [cf. Phormidesmis sp. LEGE 11477]MBE9059678.1 septal ring lytic transglycosylase RlpA family protein [cf. Phormidesmis sp. LEGE 11477]